MKSIASPTEYTRFVLLDRLKDFTAKRAVESMPFLLFVVFRVKCCNTRELLEGSRGIHTRGVIIPDQPIRLVLFLLTTRLLCGTMAHQSDKGPVGHHGGAGTSIKTPAAWDPIILSVVPGSTV